MDSYKWFVVITSIYLITLTKTCHPTNKFITKSLLEQFHSMSNDIKECLKDNFNGSKRNLSPKIITTWGKCLRITTLKKFDDIMSSNVINLMDGVKLIRYSTSPTNLLQTTIKIKTSKDSEHSSEHDGLLMKHKKYKTPLGKISNKINFPVSRENIREDSLNDLLNKNRWSGYVLNKFMDIFRHYILQIKLIDSSTEETGSEERGRHRRRNNMMMIMMFGVTAMGAIIVPIGFQFLSMISGKALLLAKMALLLASINGLKRIAGSGIHYGLYHVPEHHHNGMHGYFDRESQTPRNQEEGSY